VNEMVYIKLILSGYINLYPFYASDKFVLFKNDSHSY